MTMFFKFYLHLARGLAEKDPEARENLIEELGRAIAADDRKKVCVFAQIIPELFKSTGAFGYVPIAQMGYVSSRQTIMQVAEYQPKILDSVTSNGCTIAHYAAQAGRADILDTIIKIKPELAIVKNKYDETPYDELLHALQTVAARLQKEKTPLLNPRH